MVRFRARGRALLWNESDALLGGAIDFGGFLENGTVRELPVYAYEVYAYTGIKFLSGKGHNCRSVGFEWGEIQFLKRALYIALASVSLSFSFGRSIHTRSQRHTS